ncbi:hypothetical protein WICPIJ_007321 [Wickerhamomyces pijperi]|uniref:Amino acid transporter transmembrane domain-containing protein n=1 Tax=Wickerhamomyces pijperi TaxID=599730 RepID=A0A9P8Q2U2_WICPI|nr:hypothetical protein WICPIJ_007321 [Wickerhamomyces pijperi]
MEHSTSKTANGLDISASLSNKRRSMHTADTLNVLNNEYAAAGSYKSTISMMSHSRRQSTARLVGSPLIPTSTSIHNNSNNNNLGDEHTQQLGGHSYARSSFLSSPQESPRLSQMHQHNVDPQQPSFMTNSKDDQRISEHTLNLYVNDSSLRSVGGDITHELKTQNQKLMFKPSMTRRKSGTDLISEYERRGSGASGLNVPGGFRREFIVNKQRKLAVLNNEELKQVPFFTKNFMEFLYIYGHFAGEDFDEDFAFESNEDSDESALYVVPTERTALLNGAGGAGVSAIPTRYEAKGTTSTAKAFFIMLKAFIGTGILFLPKAFDNGGLLFSIIALLVFGVYSYYCYYILVSAKAAVGVSSFGEIGLKLYGGGMRKLILTSLVLTQVGFICAYIIFTAENITAFLKNMFSLEIDIFYVYVFQAVLFIPLSFIRSVSKLSFTSFLANILILGGLVIVFTFCALELFNSGVKDSVEFVINKSRFSIFIGTAIFAFEGIGLIIPIQNSMQHPEKFPLVLALVIMTISVLMLLIATTGYLAYGADIQTVILLNLPQSNIFVQLIQCFYSCAILLSIPLQIFPAIGIVEKGIPFLQSSGKRDLKAKWAKNFFRSLFVIMCIMISWYGAANLDKFVSFVGCFACIPLVYMYPPMFHLKTNPGSKGFDYLLLLLGFICMIYTSYQIIFETS